MKTRTIAFVSDSIHPYNKGGKETRLFHITTRLAREGADVHIYTMKWWHGRNDIIESGVKIHAISPLFPLYHGPRRSIKQGILFGFFCLKLLTAKFDIIDVDHMPFFPLYSVRLVCWLKRKKMIGTWNEVWGDEYWQEYLSGLKGKIAALIEKVSVKLPDHLVSISPHTTQKLIQIFEVPTSKITTIACGYDQETIDSTSPSHLQSDVVYVGRLLSHKHVEVLIKAIALAKKQKPDIVCRIIGAGPEKRRLRNLQLKLKLEKNIVFHGEVTENREVFSLMKASKVFVLPSTREGFGIVVIEANYCGLPVIAIDHPDNAARDLAQITVSLDEAHLADQILQSIKDQNSWKLNSSMKENVKKYPWSVVIQQNKKVYGI